MPTVLGREYRVFKGDMENTYRELMPQVIKAGFVPANILDVMTIGLAAYRQPDFENRDFWLKSYFDVADGIAYPRENSRFSRRFKLDLDSRLLMSEITIKDQEFRVSDGEYATLPGPEFIRVRFGKKEFALLASKFQPRGRYSKEDLYDLGATPLMELLGVVAVGGKKINVIENSDLWLALSRYDFGKDPADPINVAAKQLLTEFSKAALAEGENLYHKRMGMGISLGLEEEKPRMRGLYIDGIIREASHIDGGYDVPSNYYGNRIVGFKT